MDGYVIDNSYWGEYKDTLSEVRWAKINLRRVYCQYVRAFTVKYNIN